MVRKAKRNREAEEYNNELIPKDTQVICGITEVEASVRSQDRGKFKGKNYDRVRVTYEVLAGDFAGSTFSVNLNNNTDRMGNAGSPYDPWPYGNSKKYCEVCCALIDGCEPDDVLIPEEENLEWYEQQFRGKVLVITVGTFTFKINERDDEGNQKEITIQTQKVAEPLTEDLRKEYAEAITTFETTMAMAKASPEEGSLGGLGEDDDEQEDLPF